MSEDILNFDDIAAAMGAEDTRPIEVVIHDAIVTGDKLDIFPAADAFPLMKDTDEEGFLGLVEDIKKNDVNESIKITKNGQVVDGRNRIAAIVKAIADGTKPQFDVEVLNKTSAELNSWVISTNLHRRHLTTSQRAMLASDLVTTQPKNAGGNAEEKTSVSDAAKLTNVSERQVKSANQVKKLAEEVGAPEVVADVKAGKKTVGAAQSELKQAKAAATPAPAKPKAKTNPKAKTTAKKVVKPQKALTDEQLTQIKDLLPLASQPQLMGLRKLIDTALGGSDDNN